MTKSGPAIYPRTIMPHSAFIPPAPRPAARSSPATFLTQGVVY